MVLQLANKFVYLVKCHFCFFVGGGYFDFSLLYKSISNIIEVVRFVCGRFRLTNLPGECSVDHGWAFKKVSPWNYNIS